MKPIANYISFSRIVLSLTMFFLKPLSIEFFIVYFLCGLSDVFDGYIARKTNTESKLGAKIDSFADLLMLVILGIVLFPIINLSFSIIVWIAFIAFIRVGSILVVFLKYKTFAIPHTYGNKLTGFVLIVFLPVSLALTRSIIVIYVICLIATISAIEELFINLSSKKLEVNKKSIFFN
ncbi:MAG: CDP-alcohol phosphatidyltransferase family protein [Clostridiaceae bacterium]